MNNETVLDREKWKRSLIMKIGSAVFGLHVAVLCVFALTQGCITTESQGSGRGAGARQKGLRKHEHTGKVAAPVAAAPQDLPQDMGELIIDEGDISIIDMPVEPVAPVAPSTQTYVVQKGDILGRIASKFDISTKKLIEMNNLTNPDVLYVGQELVVPAAGTAAPAAPAEKSSSSIEKGGTYEIQKGDTLSEIASAAGVSVADLCALNDISPDKIFAGQTIYIPKSGKVPAKKARKAAPKKAAPAPAPVIAEPTIAEPAIAEPAPVTIEAPTVEPVETTAMSVDMVADKVLWPGETLDDVARQYGVSKAEIMRLNNIVDESQVREGQRLRVPISE